MYVEVVVAVEAHEIMPVALVVAEEKVLAVYAAVVLPPLLCLLDGLALGMVVACEGYVVFLQIGYHFLLSLAYFCCLILAYWQCLSRYMFHLYFFENNGANIRIISEMTKEKC